MTAATPAASKGRELQARLWVGASSGTRIWLNGELVADLPTPRSLAPRSHAVPVKLAKGHNRLLVGVDGGSKAWAFVLDLEDYAGQAAEITDRLRAEVARHAH